MGLWADFLSHSFMHGAPQWAGEQKPPHVKSTRGSRSNSVLPHPSLQFWLCQPGLLGTEGGPHQLATTLLNAQSCRERKREKRDQERGKVDLEIESYKANHNEKSDRENDCFESGLTQQRLGMGLKVLD